MSAKEFYHKSLPNLPDIPPEIWQTVIDYATLVSGIFDPELTPSNGLSTSHREQQKKFKESLVTRRYLVRVCKAWHTLASPFLYEYVLLGRGRCLAPLRDAMLRSPKPGECSIGWWIKRLDVSMRDDASNPPALIYMLADIIAQLPNLRVLTFCITGHGYDWLETLPSDVLNASLPCRNALKFVNWYNDTLLPSTRDWTFFLQNHPFLESISGQFYVEPHSEISLDSVYKVYAYPSEQTPSHFWELWEIDLPAVRDATYSVLGWRNYQSTHQVNAIFFERIGPQLTTIRLNCLQNFIDMQDERMGQHLRATVDEILRHCGNLEQVNIDLHPWYLHHLDILAFPANVRRFGIRLDPLQISNRSAQNAFKCFTALSMRNPKLKTIQFLDKGNVQALRRHLHTFEDGLQTMTRLGVDLRDHEGCIMKNFKT